ncbi:hypothetical protein NQ317_002474, partial [Molorchus minor]
IQGASKSVTFFQTSILRKVVIFFVEKRRFQVRKAYIDRSYVLNNCHHFPQIAKRVTAYPLQQFFPSGKMRGRRPRRWQQNCHPGGEAAGSAQPPRQPRRAREINLYP